LAGFFAAAQSWREGLKVLSADVAFILLSGGCTVLALVVVRRMGWRGKFGSVYSGFFIGMLLVFLGNVSDGIYDRIWGATPFPSFSDALYLLGYSVATVTLLRFLWFFRKAVNREGALKLIVSFILSVSGLIVVFLLSHIVTQAPVVTLSALYPILDVFAVTLSAMMLAFFRSRFISPPWKWFALGVLLMGVGHFLNGLGTTEGWYSYPQPLDLFYLWGYTSLGLGFSMQTKPEVFWRE
jgi:hypothetical protein